jgi:hypothetical protein
MIHRITNILTASTLTLLLSCGGDRQSSDIKDVEKENPKPLQTDEIAISSFRGQYDLTQELYEELVRKNAELQKLEKDIEAFNPNVASEKFFKYDNKSVNFYNSANEKANSITDSLLKKRISSIILTSKNKYQIKTNELNSILNSISQNTTKLKDHHSVLKIILTLPLIEKYQKDNIPDKNEFNSLDTEQQKLIKRIDNLTPKY